jgi:hypothetical protein
MSARKKGVRDLVMLFWRKLRLHRRVSEPRQDEIAAQAGLLGLHRSYTIAFE